MTQGRKQWWRWAAARAKPGLPYLPAVLVTMWLAYESIGGILERAGRTAVPLDDAFIHFQYARNLANGHFFHYAPGQGYTAGFTSLLWPLAFVPFFLLGMDGLSIVWVAWVYGFAAFAGVIVEVFRLTDKLTGTSVAWSASAMCALFGGFIWFAASGMETMALSWMLLRTARLATTWCEARPSDRSRRLRNELVAFGLLAPLLRPEGALASVFAAATLGALPRPDSGSPWRSRLLGLTPLAGPLIMPLMHLIATGSATSNTSAVKWLPANPYYPTLGALWGQVGPNLHTFFSTLLNGEQWSAVYLPEGSLPFAIMALVAIPVAGWRSRRPWRAMFVLAIALAILVPCTYHTFLWNRLRYLWPFAPAWFIGVACFARLAGDAAALIRPRWGAIAPVIGGIAAGSLVGNLKWTWSDLNKSSAAIDQQQVVLGQWARDHLPQNAIIGVNDTGAIAYFSERTTFDIIGLTTQGEAPHWVAGPGSRFEHYERLYATAPERFPTHFIVYPNWMQCEVLLGPRLHAESVYDQTILGGTTMIVYEARVDLLGSGAQPRQHPGADRLIDELDVADLVSEREHAYEIEHGVGREVANQVHSEYGFATLETDSTALPDIDDERRYEVGTADAGLHGDARADADADADADGDAGAWEEEWEEEWEDTWEDDAPWNPEIGDDGVDTGGMWADGGRFYRYADRFVARLRPGEPTTMIARWVGPDEGEAELVVESGGHVLGTVRLAPYRAQETALGIPAEVAAERTPIQVRVSSGGSFGSLHYWFAVPE